MTSENVIKVSFEPQQDPMVEMFAVLPENLPSVIDDARRFIAMSTARQDNVSADHIIQDGLRRRHPNGVRSDLHPAPPNAA
jgi:hypothetical protein